MRAYKFVYVLVMSLLLLLLSCTKEIERIIYQDDPDYGKIVGIVVEKDSQAKVYVRQALFIDSTSIDPQNGAFEIDSLQAGNYDVLIIAPGYGTFKSSNVFVFANSVAYVGKISLPRLPDLIHSHFPDNQAEIPISSYTTLSIIINFTRPMDRQSVQNAFATVPASEGTFHWSQSIYNPNQWWYWDRWAGNEPAIPVELPAEISTFTHIRCMQYVMRKADTVPDVNYTVILSTIACDSAGNPLSFPLEFSFRTIESTYTQTSILTDPENGAENVGLSNNHSIYIMFPKRMNERSVEQAISMIPNTDVIFLWPAPTKLKIYTGGPLKADTTYIITIDTTAHDLDGVHLTEPFRSLFSTEPVRITGSNPQNGEVFVELQPKIYLYFNTYMIASTLPGAFTITPSVNGTFNWESNSRVYFLPNQNLQPYTKYKIEVKTTVKDYWSTPLKEPYSFSFATKKL